MRTHYRNRDNANPRQTILSQTVLSKDCVLPSYVLLSRPQRLNAIRKLRKQRVGIDKIARKLGVGVSVVQRIVAEGIRSTP